MKKFMEVHNSLPFSTTLKALKDYFMPWRGEKDGILVGLLLLNRIGKVIEGEKI